MGSLNGLRDLTVEEGTFRTQDKQCHTVIPTFSTDSVEYISEDGLHYYNRHVRANADARELLHLVTPRRGTENPDFLRRQHYRHDHQQNNSESGQTESSLGIQSRSDKPSAGLVSMTVGPLRVIVTSAIVEWSS